MKCLSIFVCKVSLMKLNLIKFRFFVLHFAVICDMLSASKEFQKIVSMILEPVDGF